MFQTHLRADFLERIFYLLLIFHDPWRHKIVPLFCMEKIILNCQLIKWLENSNLSIIKENAHSEKYISFSFQIEWNLIVVTVFLFIISQMEFHLVQNRKLNRHFDHIPFNLKGKKILFFYVHNRGVRTLSLILITPPRSMEMLKLASPLGRHCCSSTVRRTK